MARVVVVGGSVAGLSTALMLCRAGHQVTVLERDGRDFPSGPPEAAVWDRPTVAQYQQTHSVLARGRRILAERLPDVMTSLRQYGVREFPLIEWLPSTAERRDQVAPGSVTDLVTLGVRRSTLEWVLRTTAMNQPDLRLRIGVVVAGLIWGRGRRPRAVGVRTREGEDIPADLVVDASGRRSELSRWARTAGVALREWNHDCAIVAYTRFYRLRDPEVSPPMLIGGATQQTLDGTGVYAFLTDDATISIAVGRHPEDHALRSLASPTAFDAAVSALPLTAPVIDPEMAEPISGVHVMAGIRSRLRPNLRDGLPELDGIVGIGDAYATTNPAYGRGLTLALRHAEIVTDALHDHPDPGIERDLALARRLFASTYSPWFDNLRHDDQRTRIWEATLGLPPVPGRPMSGISLRTAFLASRRDSEAYVRWLRAMQLLDDPADFFDDEELAARLATISFDAPRVTTRQEVLRAIERAHRLVPRAALR